MKPKVFVVMPVHDRLKFTKRCLGDLGRQKYKDLEIIINSKFLCFLFSDFDNFYRRFVFFR